MGDVFEVGTRVVVGHRDGEREVGTVKFVGKFPVARSKKRTTSSSRSEVVVYGIELDRPKGTHSGWFKGKRYFECRPHHGLFVERNGSVPVVRYNELQRMSARQRAEALQLDKKRWQIANSLLGSERSYLATLSTVVEVFLRPGLGRGVVEPLELHSVFQNIEELLAVHVGLIRRLDVLCADWTYNVRVGAVFVALVPAFGAYAPYLRHRAAAAEALASLRASSEGFDAFVAQGEGDLRVEGTTLDAMLARPVARLPHLISVLHDVASATPKSHRDLPMVAGAVALLEEIVEFAGGNEPIYRLDVADRAALLAAEHEPEAQRGLRSKAREGKGPVKRGGRRAARRERQRKRLARARGATGNRLRHDPKPRFVRVASAPHRSLNANTVAVSPDEVSLTGFKGTLKSSPHYGRAAALKQERRAARQRAIACLDATVPDARVVGRRAIADYTRDMEASRGRRRSGSGSYSYYDDETQNSSGYYTDDDDRDGNGLEVDPHAAPVVSTGVKPPGARLDGGLSPIVKRLSESLLAIPGAGDSDDGGAGVSTGGRGVDSNGEDATIPLYTARSFDGSEIDPFATPRPGSRFEPAISSPLRPTAGTGDRLKPRRHFDFPSRGESSGSDRGSPDQEEPLDGSFASSSAPPSSSGDLERAKKFGGVRNLKAAAAAALAARRRPGSAPAKPEEDMASETPPWVT